MEGTMKVNKEALLEALKHAILGVGNEGHIEQSASFIFKGGKVITYSDEIMVSTPVEVKVDGIVPASELLALLSKVEGDEVEIGIEDESLVVKGGRRFKAGLRLGKELRLPIDEVPLPEKWNIIPEKLIEAMKLCLLSVSADFTKPAFACLHFIENRIESCDNYRLSRYIIKGDFSSSILLPAKAAKVVIDISPKEYSVTEGWMHFKTEDGTVLSSRLVEEKYPDLSTLVEMKEPSNVVFPEEMEKMLERVKILAEVDIMGSSYAMVKIQDGELSIKGEGQIGWAEESREVDWKGDPLLFQINSKFLAEISKHHTVAEVDKDKTRLKFTGDNFIHVIALMEKE